jgi:NAD(P)H-dependent flavin oxidoreductase YrpB (nitropropane dioxygenase family)
MKTRLTELLGIDHPIILASMAWITDADLAAAVSRAGGLGTIGPNAGMKNVTTDVDETGEKLREQIRKCRAQTDRPFAVNFVVGLAGIDRKFSDRCVAVGIEERVPVAIVSQGSPLAYTPALKEAGMKVIHVCSAVRHVRKAADAGVDAVIVSGTEGGGHSGFDQITTLCLVPQAVDAVRIPVVAGGGIGDGRGLMAALSLGAEGVYMGTRFIATKECPAHQKAKDVILAATDTGTISLRHGAPSPTIDETTGNRGFVEERRGSIRLVINDYIRKVMAEGKFSYDEIFASAPQADPGKKSNRTVDSFIWGKLEGTSISAGQISGLIRDLPTCRELIEHMIGEADAILKRLQHIQETR